MDIPPILAVQLLEGTVNPILNSNTHGTDLSHPTQVP